MHPLTCLQTLVGGSRFAVFLGAAALTGVTYAETLAVTVVGIDSTEGRILMRVDDAQAFAGNGPHAVSVILPAREGAVTFNTDALAPGSYAVRVLHDENGNGELDTNLVGVPTEPWGFSNDARGRFGPPGFEAARFELASDNVEADARSADARSADAEHALTIELTR